MTTRNRRPTPWWPLLVLATALGGCATPATVISLPATAGLPALYDVPVDSVLDALPVALDDQGHDFVEEDPQHAEGSMVVSEKGGSLWSNGEFTRFLVRDAGDDQTEVRVAAPRVPSSPRPLSCPVHSWRRRTPPQSACRRASTPRAGPSGQTGRPAPLECPEQRLCWGLRPTCRASLAVAGFILATVPRWPCWQKPAAPRGSVLPRRPHRVTTTEPSKPRTAPTRVSAPGR